MFFTNKQSIYLSTMLLKHRPLSYVCPFFSLNNVIDIESCNVCFHIFFILPFSLNSFPFITYLSVFFHILSFSLNSFPFITYLSVLSYQLLLFEQCSWYNIIFCLFPVLPFSLNSVLDTISFSVWFLSLLLFEQCSWYNILFCLFPSFLFEQCSWYRIFSDCFLSLPFFRKVLLIQYPFLHPLSSPCIIYIHT